MIRAIITALFLGVAATTATAGDWAESCNLLGKDVLTFTGAVELGDSDYLWDYIQRQAGHDFILEIETPGGVAVEGIAMCDMLTTYPGNVTTVAIGTGAWSSGAMMWIGGDVMIIRTGSVVGFHLAYIPGCYQCDCSPINSIVGSVLTAAAVRGDMSRYPALRQLVLEIAICRADFGPQGFVMINSAGKKDIGVWWEYYPEAVSCIINGEEHVGRTGPCSPDGTGFTAEHP